MQVTQLTDRPGCVFRQGHTGCVKHIGSILTTVFHGTSRLAVSLTVVIWESAFVRGSDFPTRQKYPDLSQTALT